MDSIEELGPQVKKNCDISDAKYWGNYTTCGLVMRLRDMYKWRNGLAPWEEPESEHILSWIESNEAYWKGIEELDFSDIHTDGKSFNPYDTERINESLEDTGYIYGAGYGTGLRPTFFLGKIDESFNVDGHRVYIIGDEKARDLSSYPAQTKGDFIYARKRAIKFFLWDKIFEFDKFKKKEMKYALIQYGIDDGDPNNDKENLKERIDSIAREQLEAIIYHELGEIRDDIFPPEEFKKIICDFPGTPLEMFIRGVKDLSADTNEFGMLYHIIKERNAGALGFYVSLLNGFKKLVFPEIKEAFGEFMENQDWGIMDDVRKEGLERARDYSVRIRETHRITMPKGIEYSQNAMVKEFLKPLGY